MVQLDLVIPQMQLPMMMTMVITIDVYVVLMALPWMQHPTQQDYF